MVPSTKCEQKYTEDEAAAQKMFQLDKASSIELGILVIDDELREYYGMKEKKDAIISLPELAVKHHRTWFCIDQKKHIPKVAVATAELQSMLLSTLEYYDLEGQHLSTELQRQYLFSALAYLLLIEVEVKVRADGWGRPTLCGQEFKQYHFGDLLIMDDCLRIGLGKHVGAAQYWLDLQYIQFQNGARLRVYSNPADKKPFPTITNRLQDTGISGTTYQRAPIRFSSSQPTTIFIDLSEVK